MPDPDFGRHADTFFLIGNNTAEAHPILFNRMAAVKSKNPDKVKVILADPRKTRSGTIADLWLPFATGRDLVLINAMAYVIAHELDSAKYDVEKGTVTAKWKYLDKKFIERHVSFGIHEDVKKTWIKTVYGGTRDSAWDLTYTAEPRKTYPNLKNKYAAEDDIIKDLYKGFAVFLKFLEDYKPEKVSDVIFEGECGECNLCDQSCYMKVRIARHIDEPGLRDINCIYCGRCTEGCETKGRLIKIGFRR